MRFLSNFVRTPISLAVLVPGVRRSCPTVCGDLAIAQALCALLRTAPSFCCSLAQTILLDFCSLF